MRVEYETKGLIRFWEMRIHFGMILTVLRDGGLMRIWFGLILKIMVRTKSYILPELCYLTKSIGKCAKL